MNLKEFKRRFILGLIEPELFYLPIKSNKSPEISRVITIALTSFQYYDYDANTYGGEMPVRNAIVVINSKGQVVFSSKKYNDMISFSINNLPYGVYYVKVIRSSEYKVDNVWHKIIINQDTQTFKIHLDWQGIYKTHTYLKDDVVKSVVLGNKQDNDTYTHINDLIVKGYAVNDYYIDDKLIWSCNHREDVYNNNNQIVGNLNGAIFAGRPESVISIFCNYDFLILNRNGSIYDSGQVKFKATYDYSYTNYSGSVDYDYIPYIFNNRLGLYNIASRKNSVESSTYKYHVAPIEYEYTTKRQGSKFGDGSICLVNIPDPNLSGFKFGFSVIQCAEDRSFGEYLFNYYQQKQEYNDKMSLPWKDGFAVAYGYKNNRFAYESILTEEQLENCSINNNNGYTDTGIEYLPANLGFPYEFGEIVNKADSHFTRAYRCIKYNDEMRSQQQEFYISSEDGLSCDNLEFICFTQYSDDYDKY